MKKYFISADIEGITDVTAWCETEKGNDGYEEARMQMNREVAAASQAIIDAGHQAVVRDGHDSARNLIHSMLPKGTVLMRGWACHPGSMMALIDETFDGALYVGYHAPAGTDGSPLAHTISYDKVNYIKVNGSLASEFTLNSLYAAQFGIPSIFISGDKTICDCAEAEIPGIYTAPVKDCHGNSTINIHPEDACALIYNRVSEALKADIAPRALSDSYEVEISLKNHQAITKAAEISGVEQIDVNVVKFTERSLKNLNILREQIMAY